jgi:serine/threonine protein kinase
VVTTAKLTKVRAIHASSTRGARQVAVVATQELGNVSALPTYERSLFGRPKRQRVVEWLVRNGWSDVAARLVGERIPQRRIAEQDRALDGGAELADVTRPIMSPKLIQQVLRCARMPGELFVEGLDQQWNVVAALAQSGQSQGHDVEPVVEIGAEVTTVDRSTQVLVRGGDDTDVDARLIAPADALDHAILDHAQQPRLQIERQLSDLVEEHGATRGALDRTDANVRRTGERALLVAEQLALDQRRRNRTAVDDDERRAPARSRLVNRLGEQRLARSGLALNKDRGLGIRNPRERLEDATHRDRPPNRPAEVIIGGERLLGVVFPVLEPNRGQPELHRRGRVEPRGFDAVLREKNSVSGANITKVSTALRSGNQQVIAGDSGISENQRVAIASTESDLTVRVEDDRAPVGSIDHSYAQLPVRESIGTYANNVGRHDASIPRIMSDMVDAVSRRYEIVCRLNGGGMADLYLARTLGPGGFERLVVIKRLAKRLAAQPSAVQDMFDEARIAATLSHANIVQVNDIEIADGQVSIVMEFLHGHDVSHLLRRMKRAGQRIPLDQAVAIVLGVCAGLHHAHERVDSEGKSLDIVHRDVSPHNVFVTYDGAIKLVDFGIARASMRKGHTEHGFIKGKPGYIAPEAIRGRKPDRRTDVWGAAVLLYELTTGGTPYGPGTAFDDLAKVTKVDPPAPSTVIEDYPPELEAIVMRGLSRDPAHRYSTADSMRIALDAFARARSLDLSPFRLSALMERVFAENLEAWRQSQRLGKTLAEHVAAFKTSGVHDLIDLPGDPTQPFTAHTATTPLVTADFLSMPTTAPTRLLKRSELTEPTTIVDPDPVIEPPEPDPPRPTPMAFESLTIPEATAFPDDTTTSCYDDKPVRSRNWRKPVALALAAPLALFVSLVAWGALDAKHSTEPVRLQVPSVEQTRTTAVDEQPVAQPISVVPIEPEPLPAKPAESEPSTKNETAVAHAAPSPAKKRPSAKSAPKRKSARSTPPPRAVPISSPSQPAEEDLDALLDH